MDWREGISKAIDYIESNLTGTIDLHTAAGFISCSTWEFQRLFSFLTHTPLGEYIRQRKLTLAAGDILNGNEKIIDVALKYGYESPTAFSRAFSKLFGVAPTSARGGGVDLNPYPRITFNQIEKERYVRMSKWSERGYTVQESGPIYYTKDMEKTVKWFKDVLGWFGVVITRFDDGVARYGCVLDYPIEVWQTHTAPFRGYHLLTGEPVKGVSSYSIVYNLDALHKLVKDNGWEKITDIMEQPWGVRECQVTTPDGYLLRFAEPIG